MASKAPPVIPPAHLDTIYEESGSSLSSSSIVNIQHQTTINQQQQQSDINSNIPGLISARSIQSVDVHRRCRINEHQQKLPIEVRYRDGTKRYIHPSLASTITTSTGINRRKSSSTSSSNHQDPSLISTKINSKYRQIYDTTPKKKKKSSKKPPIILTIITAEDLSLAGVTPSSTSSPDESDTLALAKSLSNSSLDDTVKTVKDTDEVLNERLQHLPIPPVQPVIDISISNHRFIPPHRHHSHHQQQLRHPQQISTIRSQSLPSSQTHYLPPNQQIIYSNPPLPPVAVIPPSPKKSLPSIQITLTTDQNERNLSANVKIPKKTTSTSKSINETINSESNQTFRPSNTVLVGGGSRSAFRPVLKSTNVNPQPRIPANINLKPQISTNSLKQNSLQQKIDLSSSSHPYLQQFQSTSNRFTLQPSTTINPVLYDHPFINSDASKKPVYSIIPNQSLSDKTSYSNLNKTLNHSQQSTSISTTNNINKTQDIQNHLINVDSNLQWHSITSKSLYDVPRLSKKYSDIPLRITIPDRTPTHHQKLLQKHDIALEKRLLDAGLSPETIALYERILEVADIRQINILTPPEIINQYQHQSLF